MAITITPEMTGGGVRPMRAIAERDVKIVIGRVTFDYDYPSGGEALVASDLDLKELYTILFSPAISGGAGHYDGSRMYSVGYEYTDGKVLVYAGSAEALSGLNLTNFSSRFIAVGF